MNKSGRPKEPSSINSLGHDQIHLDKPLKNEFKAQADARKMTQVEYLRYLVDTDKKLVQTKSKGWQGAPGVEPSQRENVLLRIVENMTNFLAVKITDDFTFVGDTEEELKKYKKLLTWCINAEYADSKMEKAEAALKARQAQIAQAGQRALSLNYEQKLEEQPI